METRSVNQTETFSLTLSQQMQYVHRMAKRSEGRSRETEKRNRDTMIVFRASEEERRLLFRAARESGETFSSWARRLLVSKARGEMKP